MENKMKTGNRRRFMLALEACLRALAEAYPEMATETEDLLFVIGDYLEYYGGGTAR
ncbi:MAG: hypothetical protein ACM3U1_01055 [Chloroflexota bacterium]